MQYDDEGLTVRQKVKKVGNTHLLPKLNSNIGVDNSKYIININLAHDFREYAHACKRLLKQEDTPGVIMIGCGRAITRLLKIAQVCAEYFPGLHMLNAFKYVRCRTCESKHLNILNKQEESTILSNPTENRRISNFMKITPQEDGNWCPTEQISHKCRIATSFPLLLVHTLRLSFDKNFVIKGATPHAIAVGYQKPLNLPESKMTFSELLELYACTEEEDDPNRQKYPPKRPAKSVLTEQPKVYNKGSSVKEPQKVCHWHVCLKRPGLCQSNKCEKFGNYGRHDSKCNVTNPSKPEKPYTPEKQYPSQYPAQRAGYNYNEEPSQSWHDTVPERKPYRQQVQAPYISQKPVYDYQPQSYAHQQEKEPSHYSPSQYPQYQYPQQQQEYPPQPSQRPASSAAYNYYYPEEKPQPPASNPYMMAKYSNPLDQMVPHTSPVEEPQKTYFYGIQNPQKHVKIPVPADHWLHTVSPGYSGGSPGKRIDWSAQFNSTHNQRLAATLSSAYQRPSPVNPEMQASYPKARPAAYGVKPTYTKYNV
ncbi:hypothetical protein FGO68_gene8641 [Halteria grandinella]|uniref:Uncharacterized protein n=1 Tax=Halteria grandinella TaxID=5974 RepID=A0A8J8NGM0_HALGN|nr:hypothetical protein FGO68_gene8641 [Halteria grandinella]